MLFIGVVESDRFENHWHGKFNVSFLYCFNDFIYSLRRENTLYFTVASFQGNRKLYPTAIILHSPTAFVLESNSQIHSLTSVKELGNGTLYLKMLTKHKGRLSMGEIQECPLGTIVFFISFQGEGKGGRKRRGETSVACFLYAPQPGKNPATQA